MQPLKQDLRMADISAPRRWTLRVGLLGLGTGLSLAPNPAQAAAGDHIRLGEAEVIPTLFLGMEWQSNPYYAEEVELIPTDGEDEYGALALVTWPEVTVKLDGPDLALDLSAAWKPRIYLTESRRNLTRLGEGAFALNLDILPRSTIGFKLGEDFRVSTRAMDAEYATEAFARRLTSITSAMVSVRPGAALSIDLGGHFGFDDYDVPPQANVEQNANYNSKISGGPSLDVQWAFFPKTAIVVQGGANFFNWANNFVNAEGGNFSTDYYGDRLAIPDGWGWRAQAGLIGRFTERIVVNALVGYGQLKYNEDSVTEAAGGHPEAANPAAVGFDQDLGGIEGLLLTAEVSATPLLGHKLTAGYRKSFEDSWFTNYVHYHYVFGRYEAVLGSRLGATIEAGYRREQYRGEVDRNDDFVRAGADLSYNASEWLDVDIGTQWVRRASADANAQAEIEYDNLVFSIGITGVY
jgi:hypothetical protein